MMPVSCRFSKEHPSEICLCSVCHLSSDLFPRRQDGKIVLPGLLTSKESPSLGAECHPSTAATDAQELAQELFRLSPPLGLVTAVVTSPNTAERAHPPRVRSNTRTNGPGTSFGRFAAADGPESSSRSSTPNNRAEHTRSPNSRSRPRSRSQPYHTATTAVPNQYPLLVDASHPRPAGKSPPDGRANASTEELTASYSPPPAPSSSSGNSIPATPALKFCPPFVASDRISFPPSSDAAKEGVTMIPWSARRRKQKYRSGFDSVAGQGKSKTMFRYYGPDTLDSDPKKR